MAPGQDGYIHTSYLVDEGNHGWAAFLRPYFVERLPMHAQTPSRMVTDVATSPHPGIMAPPGSKTRPIPAAAFILSAWKSSMASLVPEVAMLWIQDGRLGRRSRWRVGRDKETERAHRDTRGFRPMEDI